MILVTPQCPEIQCSLDHGMVTDSIMVQHAAVLIKEVLFIYIRTNDAFADLLRKECQQKINKCSILS